MMIENSSRPIQFQNRNVFQRDRDKYLELALTKVNYLLENFEVDHAKEDGPEELLHMVDDLVNDLREARYYGFRGLGGDPTNPPDFVSVEEIAAVDHIVVMYYTAVSILRFLKHECLVRKFKPNLSKDTMLRYSQEVEEKDRTVIRLYLKTMQERMNLYNTYI